VQRFRKPGFLDYSGGLTVPQILRDFRGKLAGYAAAMCLHGNEGVIKPEDKSKTNAANAAALEEANRLLRSFSHTSAIGFGICDRELRYQSINGALAASNGIAADAHLGHTVRDVLGEVAAAIEPAFQRVLITGEVVAKEISGKLPNREGMVHWIANYFPVRGRGRRVQQMGAIAVDITELRRLDDFFSQLIKSLLRTGQKENSWRARELHDSIAQYSAALTTNLSLVTQHIWRSDIGADEQLAPTVKSLDERILAMGNVISDVAAQFPINQEP
jgi:PAS domain-containing protein